MAALRQGLRMGYNSFDTFDGHLFNRQQTVNNPYGFFPDYMKFTFAKYVISLVYGTCSGIFNWQYGIICLFLFYSPGRFLKGIVPDTFYLAIPLLKMTVGSLVAESPVSSLVSHTY